MSLLCADIYKKKPSHEPIIFGHPESSTGSSSFETHPLTNRTAMQQGHQQRKAGIYIHTHTYIYIYKTAAVCVRLLLAHAAPSLWGPKFLKKTKMEGKCFFFFLDDQNFEPPVDCETHPRLLLLYKPVSKRGKKEINNSVPF